MKTILVVDDEAKVRAMISRQLTSEGYRMREASTGKEALDAIRAGGIDLVVTDVYMPETDGIELISRLSQSAPTLGIIVMSGGGYLGTHTLLEMASRLGAARTLEKPFTPEQLRQCVFESIGSP